VRHYFDAGDPPMLIAHGTKDTHIGVYFQVALNIRAECEKHNIPHRFIPIEGARHGAWDAKHDGKNIQEIVIEFLRDFMPPAEN
jgi:para-nitrobenzyl esterase